MDRSDPVDTAPSRTPSVTGWINATVAGCAVAGPVYTLFLIDPPERWSDIPLWLMVWGGMSVIVGCFAVAAGAIPIALLTWAGGRLGCRTRTVRHPLTWAAIGTVVGIVVIPPIVGTILPRHPTIGGAATGFAIALAAWRFIAWRD